MKTLDAFLTGGTGFIGRWLLLELTRMGRHVGVLSRNSSGNGNDLLKWVDRHGGDSRYVHLMAGDMCKPLLGLSRIDQKKVMEARDVYNVAGLTGWGLKYRDAYQVNVQAPLDLISIISKGRNLRRFVQVTGYKAGSGRHAPHPFGYEKYRNWGRYKWRWYSTVKGAYHSTKIEAHYVVQQVCHDQKIPLTIINPGTLIGDSIHGEIEFTQSDAILSLVNQLLTGKLMVIPGKSDDWLPLVTVDYLAAFMAGICDIKETAGEAYWVIDERTPPFGDVVKAIAGVLNVKAPGFHLPVWMMKSSLRAGLSKIMDVSHEGLEYIISHRFNVDDENDLASQMGIRRPDTMTALLKTVEYYKECLMPRLCPSVNSPFSA